MKAAKRQLVTEEEFLSMPEAMQKVELIDGEVIVPPPPTFWHQKVLLRLVRYLFDWADHQLSPVTVAVCPVDIRFAPGHILQPDAFVLFERVPRDHLGPLDRIPQICIEVVSSNRRYDRVTKRRIYAEALVVELWTVDQTGFIERWTGPNLADTETLRDQLTSPLLPGFVLDLSKLFEDR